MTETAGPTPWNDHGSATWNDRIFSVTSTVKVRVSVSAEPSPFRATTFQVCSPSTSSAGVNEHVVAQSAPSTAPACWPSMSTSYWTGNGVADGFQVSGGVCELR